MKTEPASVARKANAFNLLFPVTGFIKGTIQRLTLNFFSLMNKAKLKATRKGHKKPLLYKRTCPIKRNLVWMKLKFNTSQERSFSALDESTVECGHSPIAS